MKNHVTAEQNARDMLERMGVPDAQEYSAGDLVELANLIVSADTPVAFAEALRCGEESGRAAERGESDMIQKEIDDLETSFRKHGFTWDQTNFAIAVLRNRVESLRQQLATMTEDRDRLLEIMCEIAGSKSLTATPTQFYQYLQRVASDATITNPEALAATKPSLDGPVPDLKPADDCGIRYVE